jgi:hypothetical protein
MGFDFKTLNILDTSTWLPGTSGSCTGFNDNGSTLENSRDYGIDPFGETSVIWTATPDSVSGPDGGFNTSSFSIDNTKLYRFSCWVYRNKTGNGRTYLGTHGYGSTNGVYNRTNGANNTNPYFLSSTGAPVAGTWELWVGHNWPAGSGTGSNHPDSVPKE